MKNNRRPEVRFPGFYEGWEERKLKEVSERVRGNDGRMDLPTLTISAASGWLDQRERFSGNIAGNEQKNYTLLNKGELSYNHGNSKLAKYGAVFVLRTFEEALVPKIYHSFKMTEEASADFIESMFATKKPDKELAKLISSGARMDGLLNINYDEFVSINITIPKIEEQKKIAKFLRDLENAIILQQQELDTLKQTKKGFMQKMFPKEGESVPELRFLGFNSIWKKQKLKELGEIKTGSTPSTTDSENYSADGILWITPTDISKRITTLSAKRLSEKGQLKARLVEPGTILVTSIASIGKNTMVTEFASFNQQINSLTPDKENDSYFLLTQSDFWSRQMKNNAASGTMQIVNKSDFSNIIVRVPQLEEQVKIGNFFKQLDEVIALQEQELDALKQAKKAFLQKMFV